MLTSCQSAFALTLLTVLSSARDVLSITFHLPKFGRCPDLDAQQQFITNIDKFAGSPWYVQSSFDTEMLQGKGRCMKASYRYNPINHKVFVSTKQFNEDNNMWETLDADATPVDVSKDEGKFTVSFNIPIFGKVSGRYTILGTDFENYSVIHGCGNFLAFLHYDCSWLFSRKQTLSPEEEEQFYNSTSQVLSHYDSLDPAKFEKVDQVNCQE